MVHAFTSAGLLPQQYKYLTSAAKLGTLSSFYIRQSKLYMAYIHPIDISIDSVLLYPLSLVVYTKHNYLSTIRKVAEESMKTAVIEAQEKKPDDDSMVQIQCFMFVYICILSCNM